MIRTVLKIYLFVAVVMAVTMSFTPSYAEDNNNNSAQRISINFMDVEITTLIKYISDNT